MHPTLRQHSRELKRRFRRKFDAILAYRYNMSRPRNTRIGRNDPCHCGSGKKYKRCHGALLEETMPPPRPAPEWLKTMNEKHKADELRREAQQGLGRPIIGTKFKGYQMVAVGNKVHYGKWNTFFEFLENYVRRKLGSDWGNAELKKPFAERHPILQWYETKTRYMNAQIKEPGKVHAAIMTGAVAAYFSLAYNLYLLEHNSELQRRLLNRLRNRDQFRGAYYEAFVAALCILAGFELALENEQDGDTTHVEFTSKSKITGNSYSVEAKSRAPNKSTLDVGNQLYAALLKEAAHQRLVFIDVNVPDNMVNEKEKLLDAVVAPIKSREGKLKIKRGAGAAGVRDRDQSSIPLRPRRHRQHSRSSCCGVQSGRLRGDGTIRGPYQRSQGEGETRGPLPHHGSAA